MPSNNAIVKEIAAYVIFALFEGGPGSGNWGHKGRLGKRGGSLPTKTGSIIKHILKGEEGKLRIPKLSRKLFTAARKARNAEVILSGSPSKMLKRLINRLIGKTIVKKLYR